LPNSSGDLEWVYAGDEFKTAEVDKERWHAPLLPPASASASSMTPGTSAPDWLPMPGEGGGERAPEDYDTPPGGVGGGEDKIPEDDGIGPDDVLLGAGRVLGTIGLVLVPTDAGDRDCGGADCVTLYRGVNSAHQNYHFAQKGIAMPKGGDATPEEHSWGNTESNYTSWSYSYEVALRWGTVKSGNGVMLSLKLPIGDPRLKMTTYKPSEQEVLIEGPIKANTVHPIQKP